VILTAKQITVNAFPATKIVERLDALRRSDPEYRLFGADWHKYRLAACLSPSQVATCETEYVIELPEDYVEFLTTAGNGGAGPGYGLERFLCLPSKQAAPKPARIEKRKFLGHKYEQPTACDSAGNDVGSWDFRYFESAASYAHDGGLGRACLTKPFPLSSPFRSITDQMWDVEIPNWDGPLKAQHQVNRQRFAEIPLSDGAIRIAHYGSAIYALLILNGPFRGQIWLQDPNIGDYVPASMRIDLHDSTVKVEHSYHPHHNAPSFSDWYTHWLNAAVPEVERLNAETIRLSKRNVVEKPASGRGELIASGEMDELRYDLYARPEPEPDDDG
jgi:hypothetical protein